MIVHTVGPQLLHAAERLPRICRRTSVCPPRGSSRNPRRRSGAFGVLCGFVVSGFGVPEFRIRGVRIWDLLEGGNVGFCSFGDDGLKP